MNKKTTPNNNPPDSGETEGTGTAKIQKLMHERLVGLIDLMNRLEESIVLADGVLEKLKQDLFKVLENPYGYSHVTVRFERDGQGGEHSGLLYYSDPWENTNAIGPIMTMLSSTNPPGNTILITGIEFVEGEPPSWVKRK